jgi:hypothetical protein
MKTVNCHRKYPITTNFLDTMLEHSIDIQEGETKLDAYRRGLKELDQIAAELRKEANPHLYQESKTVYDSPRLDLKANDEYAVHGPLPIISKDKEKIEIAIDNAETVEELKAVMGKNELIPASLINQYNKRMQELTTGRSQNFTDGLE